MITGMKRCTRDLECVPQEEFILGLGWSKAPNGIDKISTFGGPSTSRHKPSVMR